MGFERFKSNFARFLRLFDDPAFMEVMNEVRERHEKAYKQLKSSHDIWEVARAQGACEAMDWILGLKQDLTELKQRKEKEL